MKNLLNKNIEINLFFWLTMASEKQLNPFLKISLDIKLIAIDVDGVLTDGGIYFDNLGNQMKKFDSRDGMGIKLLQKNGLEIALISGSKSSSINQRAKSLDIKYALTGIFNKLNALASADVQVEPLTIV